MGTRGSVGWAIDGEEVMAYNHFDSYPTGLGTSVLNFLRESDDFERMAAQVRNLHRISDSQERPSAAQLTELGISGEYHSTAVSQGDDWYAILRNCQGDLGATLDSGAIIDEGAAFCEDSLFCEWAYVINLDDEVLEVYRGFQTEPHEGERFSGRGEARESFGGTTYHPVKMIAAYSLRELPTDEQFTELENKVYTEEEDE